MRTICYPFQSYYEAIQMNVDETGDYTVFSRSNMDTYGYIYENEFDPDNPTFYRHSVKMDECFGGQFQLRARLQSSITYILIVATAYAKKTGPFSVVASGPSNVIFKHLRKYSLRVTLPSAFFSCSVRNISAYIAFRISCSSLQGEKTKNFNWLDTSSNIESSYSFVKSIYSSNLTRDSPTYSPHCRAAVFYYDAVQLTVVTTGWYRLWSASSFEPSGYFYQDNFNPLNPFQNLLLKDHESCDSIQFALRVYLESNTKYILAVTSFWPNTTGTFSIHVAGPQNIILNATRKYSRISAFAHGK